MRVGIVTHWWCIENYGQLLQCYAFQQFLIRRGHSPFLVRYIPEEFVGHRTKRILRRIKQLFYWLGSVDDKRKHRIRASRQFERFKQERLVTTRNVYYSHASLMRSNEVDADVYSVGSDVVWGWFPVNDNGRPFFLDFGTNTAKRISYSASFGGAEISDDFRHFIYPLLKRLDFVSVREKSGVDILRSLGRSDAVNVMDPVFLLTRQNWREAFNVKTPEEDAFAYLLVSKEHFPLVAVRRFCDSRGCKFEIATVYGDMGFDSALLVDPTIPEWVRRVGSSKYFFTNSFHGAAMAIILHTPFLVFLKHKGGRMDNRLLALLERVGLSERIYKGAPEMLDAQMTAPIDWQAVDERVRAELRKSVAFIEAAGL